MTAWVLDRPLIMGVLNVTPDSFSDGGELATASTAALHGRRLAAAGAHILDVGGEATNPRAQPVTADEELARVLPVIEQLRGVDARISIDTTKASVALAAVRAGATIINDVSGGLFDPEMPAAAAQALRDAGAIYICSHLRGGSLAEVFAAEHRAAGAALTWTEVAADLAVRLAAHAPAVRASAWIDPGIGFGKGGDPATNRALLQHAGDIGRLAGGHPVVVGPSRKRFLRASLGPDATTADLDRATVAACLDALRGGANVLRVHNVALLHTAVTAYNHTS